MRESMNDAAVKGDRDLAERIRRIAGEKRITQTELAKRTDTNYQSMTRALACRRPIYAQEIPAFAAALGVTIEELYRKD